VSSQDVGIQGLEVSDFELVSKKLPPGPSGNSKPPAEVDAYNIASTAPAKNSYYCIGSGSGCVDRSVSQTCLTRELEQLPMNHREHVGQDLYGLAEECIPNVDVSMLDQLETAIVAS